MDTPISRYDVSKRDLTRGKKLKIAAVASPLLLTLLPATVLILAALIFSGTPPVAISMFFLAFLATAAGFLVGIGLSAYFAHQYSKWSVDIRERIAADGIRADEVGWFRREMRSEEKRALAALKRTDPLLEDAYRETLASRLTASRIVRSSQRELELLRRRRSRIRQMKALPSQSSESFSREIEKDIGTITEIGEEARRMLAEAESRLHLIESAAVRGTTVADSELALQKLSTRASQLPLALEAARMREEVREDMEKGERK